MIEIDSGVYSAFHNHVFLGEGHEKSERKTWAVIWLCGAMMAVEIIGGLLFGSIALVAELKKIANVTLEHYNQRAEEFWEGTRDHNVSQNIEALLQHIESMPPFTILDFGCGPGRDLKVFAEQGHTVKPLR